MTNNLNEQMREKADEIVSTYGEHDGPPSKLFQLLENLIVSALLEAHAAGRQEILDRLPSEDEAVLAMEKLLRESTQGKLMELGLMTTGEACSLNGTAASIRGTCRWLRNRLMGEGDK